MFICNYYICILELNKRCVRDCGLKFSTFDKDNDNIINIHQYQYYIFSVAM